MIYMLNCNWVATRWQYYSTHLHTNNTQNDTKQTIHRTTQIFLDECRLCPVFVSYTLAFALQLRRKQGKNLSQGSNNSIIAELSYIKFDTGKYLPISRLSDIELMQSMFYT